MIGDNYLSDVKNSTNNGITGIWKKYNNYPNDEKFSENEKYLKEILNSNDYSGYCYSLGLFTEKLYLKARLNNFTNIYFLSREGEFLKEIFDIYLKIVNDNKIKTHYLFVSRQSTFAASLNENINEETFENLFRQFNNLSINDFLKNIGLNSFEIKKIDEKCSLNCEEVISDFQQSREFYLLKHNNIFLTYYQSHILEQKYLLSEYLTQQGFKHNEHICIVDVGWKGTIQDNLSQLYKNVNGYYLGYGEYLFGNSESYKEGILFSVVPYENENDKLWEIDAGMFEKILYASHPSTAGYKKDKSIVQPIFKVFSAESGIYDIVRPIQLKIKDKCRLIFEKFYESSFSMTDYENELLKLHLQCILTMNSKKINFRKHVEEQHFENFGTFNTVSVGKISKRFNPINDYIYFKKRVKYIFEPSYFVKNCYHFYKIRNKIFWAIYSKIIYNVALRRLSK